MLTRDPFGDGVRCVIATCVQGGEAGCGSLATGMGRKAAAEAPSTGGAMQRSLAVAASMIRQRARLHAREIVISRLDTIGSSMVRSRLSDAVDESAHRAP